MINRDVFPTFELAQARIQEVKNKPTGIQKNLLQLGAPFQIGPSNIVDEDGGPANNLTPQI